MPELWVPSLSDRELRERLRRRAHLVRMRASAMNRIFGLLTQWGTRLSLDRLRKPDAMELLEQHNIPPVWRRSIREAIEVIDLLDRRIAPLEAELTPLARGDARVVLLDTIPGVGELLGLTLASEIGDDSRFVSPRKLIGYAGLSPKINQSGDRSRTGALSKAGSRTLRWAPVEAAQHAWRESNPWHRPKGGVDRTLDIKEIAATQRGYPTSRRLSLPPLSIGEVGARADVRRCSTAGAPSSAAYATERSGHAGHIIATPATAR